MSKIKIKFNKGFTANIDAETRKHFPPGWAGEVPAQVAIDAVRAGAVSTPAAVEAEKKAPKPKPAPKAAPTSTVADVQKTSRDLKKANADLAKENTALKAQLDAATTELERQRDAAETGEGDLANKVKELETENAQQAELLAEAQTAIETLTTERAAAVKELSDLKAASA